MPDARHAVLTVLCAFAFATDARAADPERVREAVEKSVDLLQRCSPEFFRQTGCVACHQHSVTSLAVAEARRRGFSFDADLAREQTRFTALTVKSFRDRFDERIDHPVASAPSVGYIALGLAADEHPADDDTDAMVAAMAGRQNADGSWTAFGHRPPLEYSRIGATALAVRALQAYGAPAMKREWNARIDRARAWLLAAKPQWNSEHAFRLLGLHWAGGEEAQVKAEVAALLAAQNTDGGWSQLPHLASDAYATGVAIFALYAGGIEPTHEAYERGVQFLLSTQKPDGSWHVATRSFPFQPYFESGFPHGHDQWISSSATGFAATALAYTKPAVEAGK